MSVYDIDPSIDYYSVLNLPPSCTLADIRRAYRNFAFKLHPDATKDKTTGEKFKPVITAYKILSDTSQRAKYDQARAQFTASRTSTSTKSAQREARAGPTPSKADTSAKARAYQSRESSEFSWNNIVENQRSEEVTESLGSIFNDLVTQLSTGGFEGVFSDFVDFLESQVENVVSESDDEFENFIRGASIAQLNDEASNLSKILTHLETQVREATGELQKVNKQAPKYTTPRPGMDSVSGAILAAEERSRLTGKLSEMKAQQRLITKRLEQVRAAIEQRTGRAPYSTPKSNSNSRASLRESASIEEELQNLKRSMGLD